MLIFPPLLCLFMFMLSFQSAVLAEENTFVERPDPALCSFERTIKLNGYFFHIYHSCQNSCKLMQVEKDRSRQSGALAAAGVNKFHRKSFYFQLYSNNKINETTLYYFCPGQVSTILSQWDQTVSWSYFSAFSQEKPSFQGRQPQNGRACSVSFEEWKSEPNAIPPFEPIQRLKIFYQWQGPKTWGIENNDDGEGDVYAYIFSEQAYAQGQFVDYWRPYDYWLLQQELSASNSDLFIPLFPRYQNSELYYSGFEGESYLSLNAKELILNFSSDGKLKSLVLSEKNWRTLNRYERRVCLF